MKMMTSPFFDDGANDGANDDDDDEGESSDDAIKYASTIVANFSRGHASRRLNKYTNIALFFAVAFVTISRCVTDPNLCDSHHEDGESTTLSFIVDKSWLAMFAMAIFTLGCVVHIFMARYVYYPSEPFEWSLAKLLTVVTAIRVLHAVVFFHGFLVGIFRVGEEPQVHYGVATVLFVSAGVETTLILYKSVQSRPTQMETLVQFVVWVTLTCCFMLYLATNIGWFELLSLGILVLYYIFLNYDMVSNAKVECIIRVPEKVGLGWKLYLPKSIYRINTHALK